MNILLRYPLRYLVMGILTGFAIIIGLLTYFSTRPMVIQHVEQQASNRLRAELNQLQGVLQLLLRTNNLEGAQSVVAALGSAPERELALLTDRAGTIIASTRLAHIGGEWSSLEPALDKHLIDQISASGSTLMQVSPDLQRLTGYITICGERETETLRPRQCGFLYQRLNLSVDKTAAVAALHRQTIGYGLGLAVVAGVLGIIFHSVITRRVERLIATVNQFTAGDTTARSRLQGQDELAHVSDAFDAMAQTITTNQQDLHESHRFLQSTLDSLSAHLAILDETGEILAVNDVWRRFAEANTFLGASYGVGMNYLNVCDTAVGECAKEAPKIAQGIREVMAGQRGHFELEYPCHSSEDQRWFLAKATCFDSPNGIRVVVAHENITERKQANNALEQSESRLAAAQQQLIDAIESLTEGFALYDAEDRLVLCNQNYREFYRESMELLVPGARFEDHIRTSAYRGQIAEAVGREEAWVRDRVTQHQNPPGPFEQELGNGRWLLISERPTSQGGIVGVRTDITERKRVEEALRKAHNELEQRVRERTAALEIANEEVRRFAYIVSHDLRAPLINLKGFSAELSGLCELLSGVLPQLLPHLDEPQRTEISRAVTQDGPEALGFIETSVTRMDGLIRGVLDLSRAGQRELHIEPVEMQAVAQHIAQTLTHQLTQQGACITIEPLPTLNADRIAMEQILGNLLSNAVKYLEPDRPGEIIVRAERETNVTRFEVCDNGRGIAEHDLPRVFELFRRVGRQNTQGEGMGLAYVQTLVRRHGGDITCRSTLGTGTMFSFTIAHHLHSTPSLGSENAL